MPIEVRHDPNVGLLGQAAQYAGAAPKLEQAALQQSQLDQQMRDYTFRQQSAEEQSIQAERERQTRIGLSQQDIQARDYFNRQGFQFQAERDVFQARQQQVQQAQQHQQQQQLAMFQAQKEQAGMQMEAQLQEQLGQSRLNQAEQIRLRRTQQDMDYLSEALAGGRITQQEFQDYSMQVSTGMNVMQRRVQDAQLQESQLQRVQMQNANTRFEQTELARVAFERQMNAQRVVTRQEGGLTFQYVWDAQRGQPALLHNEPVEVIEAQRRNLLAQTEERNANADRQRNEAQNRWQQGFGITEEAQIRIQEGAAREVNDAIRLTPELEPRRAELLAEALAWRRRDLEALMQRRQAQAAALPLGGAAAGAGVAQAPLGSRRVLAAIDLDLQRIASLPGLSDFDRRGYVQHLIQLRAYFAEYGSLNNMPLQVRNNAIMMIQTLRNAGVNVQ